MMCLNFVIQVFCTILCLNFSTFLGQINCSVANSSKLIDVNEKKFDNLQTHYNGFKVVRVSPQSQNGLDYLRNLSSISDGGVDFWKEPSILNMPVDIMISPGRMALLSEKFEQFEMNPQILIEDVESEREREQKLSDDIVYRYGAGHYQDLSFFKEYQRLDQIYSYIRDLQNQHRDMMQIETIGRTTEGRDIRVVKIGYNVSTESKPIIYLQGGIHAREWIATSTVTYLIYALVHNKDDPETKEILSKFDWYIVPNVNPDGYEYSHTRVRMWRKTRSRQVSNLCIGVDPNRNFGFKWAGEGTSSIPCSEIYHGPNAFSEPETRAIRDLILSKGRRVKAFFDVHSYSQYWLIPWGFTKDLPNDYTDMHRLATIGARALMSVHGTRYKVGQTTQLLYAAAGGADDWAKGTAKIKYSYTIELRDTGRKGFLLPADQILPTGEETFEGMKKFALELASRLPFAKL
ncbi:carboxypeptidase B-like [Brevipalpus obovatus]|uniref:carboxypeptidase B-like n=1 Tax=Brevipalpus obovatus TaxID=246614 RepID=UPI003D9E6525